jgi:hypothetical protein
MTWFGRQTLCNKTWADVAHGIAVPAAGWGHVRSGPVGASGIHWQPDMSRLELRGCGLPVFGYVSKALSCILCESHKVVLFLAIPPYAILIVPGRLGRNRQLLKTNMIKY